MKSKISHILEILNEIEMDDSVPKNMRAKIKDMICSLDGCNEDIIVDKAIQELDNIADDPGLPSYAKTQIWNAVSILESKH